MNEGGEGGLFGELKKLEYLPAPAFEQILKVPLQSDLYVCRVSWAFSLIFVLYCRVVPGTDLAGYLSGRRFSANNFVGRLKINHLLM